MMSRKEEQIGCKQTLAKTFNGCFMTVIVEHLISIIVEDVP
jgi:hypothetical protein